MITHTNQWMFLLPCYSTWSPHNAFSIKVSRKFGYDLPVYQLQCNKNKKKANLAAITVKATGCHSSL